MCITNSLDVRRGRSGRHWWNEERFGRRVRFLLPQVPSSSSYSTSMGGSFFKNASTTSTTLARLQIVNVTRQDGGDYRCRVDFNSAPSRNFKYRLVVIGKPKISSFFPSSSTSLFNVIIIIGQWILKYFSSFLQLHSLY